MSTIGNRIFTKFTRATKEQVEAFKGIPAPMKSLSPRTSPSLGGDRGGLGSYVPDFQSRYFTEDFPYGLRIIQDLARKHQVNTPTIDQVLAWGLKISKK